MAKARQQYFADEASIAKDSREFAITPEILEKINSIEPWAQANIIETVKVNWEALTPDEDKAVDVSVPLVEDTLYSTDPDKALSANQWKVLYEYIQNLASRGRYLSNWNAVTWLPSTNPVDNPYQYRAWDYYVVSNVAAEGGTNYRPNSSSYSWGVASTTVETETVKVWDYYTYDWQHWLLLVNTAREIAIDSSLSTSSTNPVENRVVTNALNTKQNNITDLETIRSWAALWATALQPWDSLSELTWTSDDITQWTTNLFMTTAERSKLSNQSWVNTWDETQTTIKNKLWQASASTDGYLTSTDWNTFNNKQWAISDLETIRSNASAWKSASDTIATYWDIVTHDVSEFATAAQWGLADTALQPNDNISELTNDVWYVTDAYHDNTKQDVLIAGNNIQIAADGKTISATDTTYTAWDFDIKDLADSTGLRTEWSWKQDELIAWTNIQIAADWKTISATDTTYTAWPGISISNNNVISNTNRSAEWWNISWTLSNQTDLQTALNAKQDNLVAGTNIQIAADGKTVSATDTTYTAGTWISIDANNVISNTQTSAEWWNIQWDILDQTDLQTQFWTKQDNLVAWTNIQIAADWKTISATDTTYTASDFDIKDLTDSTGLRTTWNNKQNTIVAWANIQIAADGKTISATDTTYTAWDFDIKDLADSTSLRTTWSGKQDKLIAGTNVQIAADGKTISATDTTYSASDFDIKDLSDSQDLRTTWSAKQDAISDLQTIRNWAAAWATAVQPWNNITVLTNNAGYITKAVNDLTNYYTKSETYTRTEIDNKIANFAWFEVVAQLPTTDIKTNIIYLLWPVGSAADRYEEYIYSNNNWIMIWETSVDLTNYFNVSTDTSDRITQWSTNLFLTSAERTKLSNTSGTNTGDETKTTIQSKLGAATSSNDWYLTSADWTTFNNKQKALTAWSNIQIANDWTISATDTTYVASDFDIKDLSDSTSLRSSWSWKQDALVSGTTIKTINSTSILWSWNIDTNQVSDTAYGSSWNWVTDNAPSKNAVYDKISAMDTTIAGKADSSSVPTKVSDLTNDSGYITSSYHDSTKQDTLATQTAYTSKWSATKVPQITTNSLWQVTWITEVTIQQPDISWKADKTEVLTKTNTTEFTPTWSYHPATKKYVDDNISAATSWAVSDEAYSASWNWVTGIAPSKNAVYDKISAIDTAIWWKQDALVAGTNIQIADDWKTISATDTKYTASDFDIKDLADSTSLRSSWSAKQDTISDLATIRTGAWKWATAVQPWDNISTLNNNSGFITKAVSDLTNYYTKSETYTKSEVADYVANFAWFKVVATLPTTDIKTTIIYLLWPIWSGADKYEEYIYSNNAWVKIWETSVDLTNYFNTSTDNSDSITQGSTHLFLTSAERTKLSNTSGTNTGDETKTTIQNKLWAASSSNNWYLSSTDWNTFYGKMPWFSLNISHATPGNPREVKFVTVNYWNMTQYGAAYFKLSAMSCHPDWWWYNYMTDIYIGCTYQWVVKCDIIKYIQSSIDQYTPDYEWWWKYFGDVFYVVDTDAKKVYFYILWWQYTTSDFTPAVKIWSTSLTNVQQHTWWASYYDTWTKVRANGCWSLVAIKSDIPSNTSQLTNDSGFITSSYHDSTKQDSLAAQTAYTAKGSATKVPQITTNALWQVTWITEVTIEQPDISWKANISDVLTKTNTTAFTPTGDYNPATKKYVDDNAGKEYTAWEWIEIKNWPDYSAMQWPAPSGFHVPLNTERQDVYNIWTALGEWSSDFWIALKLPFAGYRGYSSADVYRQGFNGNYWSSSRYNTNLAYYLSFSSVGLGPQSIEYRACGFSVRCFKDSPVVPTSSWTKLYWTSIEAGWIFWSSVDWLISLSSDWTTWITISDKNLWATQVWNSWDTLSEANCGKYYQWGNNYWFPRTWTIANQSTTQVDVSSYWPWNYYSSDTFIKYNWRWDTTDNWNLWWWVTWVVTLDNAITNTGVLSVNGQTWDVTISVPEGSNTKTFTLSWTSWATALAEAQAILDWYNAGNNPIVIFTKSWIKWIYTNPHYINWTSWECKFYFYDNLVAWDEWSDGVSYIYRDIITINHNNWTVTSIQTNKTYQRDRGVLATNTNYDTPYTPQYDWSPATKKYVDDTSAWKVSDTAYASSWNWVTTIAPSKNAVYDKIAAMDTTIGWKQDTISDLSTIRSWASAWATALQPSAISDAAYTSNWDWATTTAPSKNAVYDKISAMDTTISGKQATLVSGTNIKTINSTSLLWSGNISIAEFNPWSGTTWQVLTKTANSYAWSDNGTWDMSYSDFGWATKSWATVTLDLASTISPAANFTVNAPSSIKDGQTYILRVSSGETAYTMTLWTNITNPYDTDITLTANWLDQFVFLAIGGNLELQPEWWGGGWSEWGEILAPNSPLKPKYRWYGTQEEYEALSQYYTDEEWDTVYYTV